jgi:hypothetical protein
MRQKLILLPILLSIMMTLNAGCALFKREVIPQAEQGPHGGALVLYIDHRISEYLELVVDQRSGWWILRLYSYNKKMEPQTVSESMRAEIILPNQERKVIDLWSTEPNFIFLRHAIYHLEGKAELGEAKSFIVRVTRYHTKPRIEDYFNFSFPVNSN